MSFGAYYPVYNYKMRRQKVYLYKKEPKPSGGIPQFLAKVGLAQFHIWTCLKLFAWMSKTEKPLIPT